MRAATMIRVCIACILLSTALRALLLHAHFDAARVWMLDTSQLDSLGLGALIAILMRGSGVSVGVIARKAGTVARGSTITKSELAASNVYSARLMRSKERKSPQSFRG